MDKWHRAVLIECMLTEGCYHEDDPEQSVRELINWHTSVATENMVSVWQLVALRDTINKILEGKLS